LTAHQVFIREFVGAVVVGSITWESDKASRQKCEYLSTGRVNETGGWMWDQSTRQQKPQDTDGKQSAYASMGLFIAGHAEAGLVTLQCTPL
jgi:hypothetical protein